MKLKLEKGDLSADFDQNSPETFSLLVEMIQLLNSRKAINNGSILKVSGLNRSLNFKLMTDLCNKLGYMFLAVALAETGEEYIVVMSLSPRFPVGSVLNNPPEQ